MSVEKIVNVTIKDNAADVEKDINKLNKALDETEKKAIDVNSSFEDVYDELKPLTTRLGEAEDRMYELALAGRQNTEEYRELLKATANYRQVQIQTDLVVDTAAQTMTQKLGGALEGAASGFALVQGAMNLFGNESEEIEKALLKVQSAMALAQGIEGVRTALPLFTTLGNTIKTKVVTAFTSLKGAIAATGIGALVVAIGGLIYAMDEYNSTLEETIENEEKLREIQSKNAKELDETAKKREEERNRRKGGLNDLKRELELLEAQGASEDKLFKLRKDILDKELFNLEVRRSTFIKNNAEEKAIRDNAIEQIKNKQNEIAILDAKYANSSKKTIKEVKKFTTEVKQETDNTLDEFNRKRFQDEAEEKSKLLLEIERLENEYLNKQLSAQQQEENAVREKYFNIIELAKKHKEDVKLLEEAQGNELAAIREKYKEDEIADVEEVQNVKFDLINKNLANISNLLGLFRVENEKDAKKQFEVNKALSLAQASIQTFQAVTGALTAGGNPIKLATGAQFVEAGIAAAIGAANIAKIAKTKFKGADISASSGGSSITSASTQQLSSPNFNVVGATGISQTEELQPVKAYVVSGDVTTAQSLDRNRIQNATF